MSLIPKPRILRSNRQSLSLQVTQSGEVIVKAPRFLPGFLIQQFLHTKTAWITQALQKVQNKQKKGKTYKEGETFLYLGKPYTLQLIGGITISLQENALFFPKVLLFRAQKELTDWYMRQAKELVMQRLVYHAEKMEVSYKAVLFSDTKSKWGTCFADNSLQFNWRLIMTPLMVLDYVVIHELTHVTHKNHGDSFWRRVRLFTPAYKQHRKWLSSNAHLLEI
jgi:predicted metal-dependent hydrolase